jgi:hypothetical protein
MTDVEFVAVVAAVPAGLTSLAGLIVSLRNGKKTDDVKEKVDGNYQDLKGELTEAKKQIAVLTERLLTTTVADKGTEK